MTALYALGPCRIGVTSDQANPCRVWRWQALVIVLSLVGPATHDQARAAERPAGAVLWRARLGLSSGSPVVHRGRVLVGSANDPFHDPRSRQDAGVLLGFDQERGTFLGQVAHVRLPRRVNDLPGQGILCRPCVEGDRAWYVSNRGELVCLDLGNYDSTKPALPLGGVLWKLDMVAKLGVFKRDAGDIGNPLSSPLVIGNLVFCVTGNGTVFGHALTADPKTAYVPRPNAPSFVAVHKKTGKVVWSSNAPGKNIQYGQWASPARARVRGVDQVIFPGGDGFLYGFEARTGRLVWKVDCNPATATKWGPHGPGTRCSFLSASVVRDGIAYIGVSQDLELRDGPRPVYAVEVTHRGDATRKAIRWVFHDKDFGGTFGSVALGKGALYVLDFFGVLYCLDPKTGKELWRKDLKDQAGRFNAPCVAGEQVFVPAGEKVFLFKDSRKRELLVS